MHPNKLHCCDERQNGWDKNWFSGMNRWCNQHHHHYSPKAVERRGDKRSNADDYVDNGDNSNDGVKMQYAAVAEDDDDADSL